MLVVADTLADVDLGELSATTGLSAEQLTDLPGVLIGSPQGIADTLRRHREELGINYVSVVEPYQDAFAKVIAQFN